jgi:plastocyanin
MNRAQVTNSEGIVRQILLLGALALVAWGCAGDETGPPPSPATTVSPTSGDEQFGEINLTLLLPLRVLVDSAGTKQAGVVVTWHTTDGVLDPLSGVTDAAGIATATWTLDAVAGPKVATATVVGVNPVTFRATALGGRAVFFQLQPSAAFFSAQNGSKPAVDTIAAGQSILWIPRGGFASGSEVHRVVSVGTPSFNPSGIFYLDGVVHATLTVPGTYHYADVIKPHATGIIVVQ